MRAIEDGIEDCQSINPEITANNIEELTVIIAKQFVYLSESDLPPSFPCVYMRPDYKQFDNKATSAASEHASPVPPLHTCSACGGSFLLDMQKIKVRQTFIGLIQKGCTS